MHSIRSAAEASCWARISASWGRYSPNSTTSGLSTVPQSHRGIRSGSPACLERTSPIGYRARQSRHTEYEIEPCTSISSTEPARACSRSTFWVMTASSSPARSSSASTSCARFGCLSSSVWKRSP